MGDTIIRQQLSSYSSIIHAGKPLFEHTAVTDFADNLSAFDCYLPNGRTELGDRTSPRQIIWKVPGSGTLVPFADLTDDEKVRVRRQVDAAVQILHLEAERQGAAGRELSQVIKKIRSPQDEFIYVLGGRPVITGWGLVQDGPEPTMKTAGFMDEPASGQTSGPPPGGTPAGGPPIAGMTGSRSAGNDATRAGTRPPSPPVDLVPIRTGDCRWWVCALLVLLAALALGALAFYFYYQNRANEKKQLACIEKSGQLQEEVKQLKGKLSTQEASRKESQLKDTEIEKLNKELLKYKEIAEKLEKENHNTSEKLKACAAKCETLFVAAVPDLKTAEDIYVIWFWDKTLEQWRSIRLDDPNIKALHGKLPDKLNSQDGKEWLWNDDCGCYLDKKAHDKKAEGKKAEKTEPTPKPKTSGPDKPKGPILIKDRLGSPGLKISRLAVFEVDPPDSSARWNITIDPDSPPEVRENPQSFIKFTEPQEGLSAVGSKVVVGWTSSRPFKAVVKSVQGSGKSNTYNIVVTDGRE